MRPPMSGGASLPLGCMDTENVLLSLLLVLVAARAAAETAERLGQPAVLGEILAGIVIGPSLLGLVRPTEPLMFFAELGVVLLLFEVGMQMNLGELGRVGGDSLRVAAIGMALPMGLTFLVLTALNVSTTPALFISGALAATSVGITARLFADLRALATPEARTVLGAAAADDVGGLLVLTVVTAVAAGGGVSAGAVLTTVAGAAAFLVLATGVALWMAPALFRQISVRARTDGTLLGLGLAFALLLAVAASAAHLAPVVGAFLAGLAVSRTESRDDLHRRLVPLSHFFVPIFFLLIGVRTRLDVFAMPSVAALAAMLSVVALAGKIASGLGVRRGRANRLLVGVAMAPRGEVGLIFAGIGLSADILDSSTYGVLVAVVLVTTLVTSPWVRSLIHTVRRRAVEQTITIAEPPGGWLSIDQDMVDLSAEPPDLLSGRLGFEAAVLCAIRRPGPWLLQWLSSAQHHEMGWDDDLRRRFFSVLQKGNTRSWRFLQVTGLLDEWIPVLGAAAQSRRRDPFNLEPDSDLRWELLQDLQISVRKSNHIASNAGSSGRLVGVWNRIEQQNIVSLAALAISAFNTTKDASSKTQELSRTLGLSARETDLLVYLVENRSLIPAAAKRFDMAVEESVLTLADHIGSREKADGLYVLAVAENAIEPWERAKLDELFDLLQVALSHVDAEAGPANPIRLRKLATEKALSHLPKDLVSGHLEAAPRRYLVAQGPDAVSKHIDMTATPFARDEIRLEAEPAGEPGEWVLHLATPDRRGLLASVAGTLAFHGIPVQEAFISTWANGNAIDVFRVRAAMDMDWERIRQSMTLRLAQGAPGEEDLRPIEGIIHIDNLASPWHTIVEIRAFDRTGLLHRVTSALAKAKLQTHMAVVHTEGDVAVDIFYVTGAKGGKLEGREEQSLRLALSGTGRSGWKLRRRKRSAELEFTHK